MPVHSDDPNARRPADAYFQMESILGESYFLTHPPSSGLNVVVQGVGDRVLCSYAMSAVMFDQLKGQVMANPALHLVSAKRYKDNGDTKQAP